MKRVKITTIITAALFVATLFTACEQTDNDLLSTDQLKSTVLDNAETSLVFTTTADDLTQSDIDGLLLMREEEKMARDVYDYFYTTYGLQVFDRISTSEDRHSSSVLTLIEYFGLTDPAVVEAGVFSNADIQALYNQLIANGSTAELALSTGAFIEEYDIADLKGLLEGTSNADIIRVYTNLENGSESHLRAFTSTLLTYGVTYEPEILIAEVYAEILEGTNGNGKNAGNGSCGNGGNGTAVDANGDGICDITGEPVAQNSGVSKQGNSQNNGKGNRGN
jgi:hypothetical protein